MSFEVKTVKLVKQPTINTLDTALAMLLNTRKESKSLTGTTFVFDPSVVASMRNAFGQSVYKFRAVRASTLTSNGSGILITSIGFGLSNYSEGSSLAALFDEVRLTRTRIQFTARTVDTGVHCLAFTPSELEGTAPASFTQVMRIAGSKQIPATTAVGTITHHGKIPPGRLFASTAADTATFNAGNYGVFWGYTQTGTPHSNSAVIYAFTTIAEYELRVRG